MIRAVARIDADAIARNCARLREVAATRLCAVVKADGYGHGALTAARAAQARRRGLAGRRHRRGGARAARRRHRRAAAGDGRAVSTEELPVGARGARADVVAWRREFLDRCPTASRVHVKLDTGMGRLGTRDLEEALDGRARGAAARAAHRRDDALRHLRRRPGLRARAARRLPAVPGRAARTASSPTPPTRPPRSASPRAGWTWCAAASPPTGWTRSSATRPTRASTPGADAAPATWPRSSRSPAGQSAGYGRTLRRARRDGLAGDAADRLRRRRPPRADQQRRRARSAAAASRWSARSRWTTSPSLVDASVRARRRGGPDRRPGRRADPRRGVGAAARHDQLRDHLRGVRPCSARLRASRPGWSAAPSATGCWAATRTTSTSRSTATSQALAQALRREHGGAAFPLAEALRRLARGRPRDRPRRPAAAGGRDHRGRPRRARLHRQRHGASRWRRRRWSTPTAARPTSRRGACAPSAPAAFDERPAARAARSSGSPPSWASPSSRPRDAAARAAAPGLEGVAAERDLRRAQADRARAGSGGACG